MPPNSSSSRAFVPPQRRKPPKLKPRFTGSGFSWEESFSPDTSGPKNSTEGHHSESYRDMPTICTSPESTSDPMPKSILKSSPLKRKPNSAEANDEIVIVEDDEDTPPPPKKSGHRVTRSATALVDTDKLCEFPYPVNKHSVSVSLQDYKSLEHDTFVNDIIIDFHLTHSYFNVLKDEERDSVHLFSTMFYKRLNSTPKKNSALAKHERDSNLSSAAKKHWRVKGWTKSVDIFEKNLLVIPICEHSHWYLIVVVRPGLISIPLGAEERVVKGEPFIIVLDSMGGDKKTAVNNVRHYLAQEWKARKAVEKESEDLPSFSREDMKVLRPPKPEQKNYSDCGLYLLHYVEKIFSSVAKFLWPATIPDLTNWFTDEEVAGKRDRIATLIRELANQQWGAQREVSWPKINFFATDFGRKSRKKEQSEEEEYPWPGEGHVLGNGEMEDEGCGFAASGFYGDRAGNGETSAISESNARSKRTTSLPKRTLVDISLSQMETASESARKERHKNRENRDKRNLNIGMEKNRKCEENVAISRNKLLSKMQQIQRGKEEWDAFRALPNKTTFSSNFKIPKKPVDGEKGLEQEKFRPRVGGVSEDVRKETTVNLKVTPIIKDKPNKSNNSIVNPLAVKARQDLHDIMEGHDEDSNMTNVKTSLSVVKRKNKALEAFKASKTLQEKKPRAIRGGAEMIENVKDILKELEEESKDDEVNEKFKMEIDSKGSTSKNKSPDHSESVETNSAEPRLSAPAKDSILSEANNMLNKSISDDLRLLELSGSGSEVSSRVDSESVVLVDSRPNSVEPNAVTPEVVDTPSPLPEDDTGNSDVVSVVDNYEDHCMTGFLEKVTPGKSSSDCKATKQSSSAGDGSKRNSTAGPSTSEPSAESEPVIVLEKVSTPLLKPQDQTHTRKAKSKLDFAPSTSEPVKGLLEIVPDEVVQEGREKEKKILGKVLLESDSESNSSVNEKEPRLVERRKKSDLVWPDPLESTPLEILGDGETKLPKGCTVPSTIDYNSPATSRPYTKKYRVGSLKSSPHFKVTEESSRKEKYGRRE